MLRRRGQHVRARRSTGSFLIVDQVLSLSLTNGQDTAADHRLMRKFVSSVVP